MSRRLLHSLADTCIADRLAAFLNSCVWMGRMEGCRV